MESVSENQASPRGSQRRQAEHGNRIAVAPAEVSLAGCGSEFVRNTPLLACRCRLKSVTL